MSTGGGSGGGGNHSRESRCKLLSDNSGTKRVQPGTTGSGRQVLGTTGKVLFSHLYCINCSVTAVLFLNDVNYGVSVIA
jgi:hypothetical protein